MNARKELTDHFERVFQKYERNRMYPPSYRKESTVKTLQYKHISAVESSIKLLQTCLDDHFQSHVHKNVQREMDTLIELRDILLEMHRKPSLPFATLEPSMAEPILDQIEKEPDGAF